ncbi:MAG: hypothetical protein J5806_14990, partial [Lentisphaeria bacterium]|nr:hypothetical protein [Lentisphaeria bacterium]
MVLRGSEPRRTLWKYLLFFNTGYRGTLAEFRACFVPEERERIDTLPKQQPGVSNNNLDILEERIRSRLEMGLIADISSPDYETRMAILRKKEEADGYHIDDAILDYIAKNINSNIRELEGCLNRIRAKSILERRTITLDLAEEILKDLISPDESRSITSNMIINIVAEHFRITTSDLKSSRREHKYSYPRKIAMYLCREM